MGDAARQDRGEPAGNPPREADRRLPAPVEQVTGYRYCTAVRLLRDHTIREGVLLAGEQAYDAGLVERELAERGYVVERLKRVESGGGDQFPWRAWVTAFPPVQPGWEFAVVRFPLGAWDDWHSIRVNNAVHYDPVHRTWAACRGWQYDDDEDRELLVTQGQARRIARLLGTWLPDRQERREIYERARRLRQRAGDRTRNHAQWRARRFGRALDELRAQAAILRLDPPARRERDSRYSIAQQAVARLPAVDVEPGQAFPLLRFMYGSFEDRRSEFTANKLHVGTPAGAVTVTLTVWLAIRSLDYLAVTPFNPAEGYPIDAPDSDPQRRAAKLNGPQRRWGGMVDVEVEEFLPVSPARLWIFADAEPDAAGAAGDLWLELAFPNAGSYLAAPNADHLYRPRLLYQEFVPTGGPDLAEVPGLAPRWVSLNMPPFPDLLKAVTARLRHRPGRPTPHQPAYFED